MNFMMTFYNFHFRGYWTEKIIAWIWLATTPVWIVLFWRSIWTKIYTGILSIALMISILAMAIPFFCFVYFVSTIDDYQQIQITPQYRMEISRIGVLAPVASVEVYQVKYVIFERKIVNDDYKLVLEALSQTDVKHPHVDDVRMIQSNSSNGNIVLEYHLNGKTVTVSHEDRYLRD